MYYWAHQGFKSSQVIEHIIASVVFSSNFLGWSLTTKSKEIKNLFKCVSKLAEKKCKKKDGLEYKELKILWDKIKVNGGISSLTSNELRTFTIIVFCYHTLCRFSCVKVIKLSDLKFENDYFDINVVRSKTDQSGHGQNVLLPKLEGDCDPHLLMCLYLNSVHFNGEENYLFPPLKWDKLSKSWVNVNSKMLSYSAAYSSFKKFLIKFGLNHRRFALHSPRIGGTTNMFQNKVPKRIIDRVGRWKSSKSKYIYGRDKKMYLVNKLRKQPLI